MTKRLGILGGGQLGRMSAMAASKLGIETVIFTPEKDSPASQVAAETIVAAYDDEAALKEFSAKVEVISYEFENIPVETIRFLKNFTPVFPDERLLEISQDRINEKTYLNGIGIETARWKKASRPEDIETAFKDWNQERLIIKTTRFGYDGKGQIMLRCGDDIRNAWDQLKSDVNIIEQVIPFECEISVIVARDAEGRMVTYGPQRNEHKNHILHRTIVPALIQDDLSRKTLAITEKLAEEIDLRGVLALEMFVTRDGRILANEIAPRTHNSGHWTIDACAVSQFENHVRAVCGLPVLDPGRHSDTVMINLIGDEVHDLKRYENDPKARIHLYGKVEARPGRKMGHVTILKGN